MKRLIATWALLCVAAAVPPASPEAALEHALGALGPDQPGCAAGIIEHGRLGYARGFGAADLETHRPITPQTAFNLASMSKSFTAAAVALLIRDHVLSPEDDIRRWLPELPDYGVTIRLRHLLNHTSGLRNHMALAAFQPGAPLPSQAEALALVFRQRALNFAPGSRHQYESPNYVLLAEIVARASHMSFERFLETRIFRPLGMRHTGFAEPGLARVYAAARGGGFRLSEQVNGARGSSNLLSTLEDFAIWLNALDSDRLGRGLLARMMAETRLNDGAPLSYGYGLSKQADYHGVPGLTMISHGGQTAAWRSLFDYFPGRRFGAILLCNRSDAPREAVGAAVDAWVAAHFQPRPAAAPAAQPPSAEEAAGYAGIYYDAEADELRSFAAEGSTLKFVYLGHPYDLTPLGGGRFALGDNAQFHFADGAMIETGRDEPRVRFTRLTPAGAVRPEDYAGRYRSAEVDGEIVIGVEGGALAVTAPFGSFRPVAVERDGFWAPESDIMHLAFTRGRDDAVDGFTITATSGINRLRFARLAG